MTTQGRRALAIKTLIRQLDFYNEELGLVGAEPGQGGDTNEVADEEAPAVEELLDSGWEIDVGLALSARVLFRSCSAPVSERKPDQA